MCTCAYRRCPCRASLVRRATSSTVLCPHTVIESYMTERIMTFVVCVQRVLKEGIISGNFSLLQQGIFL